MPYKPGTVSLAAMGAHVSGADYIKVGLYGTKDHDEAVEVMENVVKTVKDVSEDTILPSVTGSCSHPTGNGLGAALFGPAATAVLATIVLIFQAILLAHGGITTLGANIVSMGIVGPLVGWLVYLGLKKAGCPSKINIFLIAFIADFATYLVTAIQLGLAFPEPNTMAAITKFFLIFAPTQLPLAVAEGLLTVIIWNGLMSYKPKLLNKLGAIADKELQGE